MNKSSTQLLSRPPLNASIVGQTRVLSEIDRGVRMTRSLTGLGVFASLMLPGITAPAGTTDPGAALAPTLANPLDGWEIRRSKWSEGCKARLRQISNELEPVCPHAEVLLRPGAPHVRAEDKAKSCALLVRVDDVGFRASTSWTPATKPAEQAFVGWDEAGRTQFGLEAVVAVRPRGKSRQRDAIFAVGKRAADACMELAGDDFVELRLKREGTPRRTGECPWDVPNLDTTTVAIFRRANILEDELGGGPNVLRGTALGAWAADEVLSLPVRHVPYDGPELLTTAMFAGQRKVHWQLTGIDGGGTPIAELTIVDGFEPEPTVPFCRASLSFRGIVLSK